MCTITVRDDSMFNGFNITIYMPISKQIRSESANCRHFICVNVVNISIYSNLIDVYTKRTEPECNKLNNLIKDLVDVYIEQKLYLSTDIKDYLTECGYETRST